MSGFLHPSVDQAQIQRDADRLDAFIRRQKRACFIDHRRRADFMRMHPADYETILLDISRLPFPSYSDVDRYRGMEIEIDDSCSDGPVVECQSWWEHGRSMPRGYVPSEGGGA